ncbi:MAG: L,D-transpeptidase family protein [Akkermansia sp.]|nr:L,D-transpeptidase family protein [Akkermansia sp.]
MKAAIVFLFVVLGVVACQSEPEVSIHGHKSAIEGVPSAQSAYVMAHSNGLHTGYKLANTSEPVPQSHEEFINMANYPQTFNVWMNPHLMQQSGHRIVRIMLSQQRGLYLVNGEVAMDFPVCTGQGSKRTPTGVFSIKEKHIRHHSNLYDCPMPYFMRLTWGGIGMHVGDIYRKPASHGCIRLPRVACEPLYRALPYGSSVQIEP